MSKLVIPHIGKFLLALQLMLSVWLSHLARYVASLSSPSNSDAIFTVHMTRYLACVESSLYHGEYMRKVT
jgi:hypothetical protein